jgi:dethiobiotin synthetase
MKNGIFITGTGTGVGKTHVGSRIAAALRDSGVDVGVMKPVETGCRARGGVLVPRDAVALVRAARVNDPLDQVNPYRFREALAPFVAAERAGASVSMQRIMASFRELRRRHQCMIVEGAGGIMVPLTRRASNIDLARSLGLPVLVVALPSLGTINHTVLTIMALRSFGISCAGIIINSAAPMRAGVAERTNPAVIERMTGIPVLGTVAYGQDDLGAVAASIMG